MVLLLSWCGTGFCAQQLAEDAFDRGVALTREGDYPQALDAFRSAELEGDRSARLYFNIGVVHYRMRQFAAARSAFRKVGDDIEMRDLALYNLGLVDLADGDLESAARRFDRVRREAREPALRALADRALLRATGDGRVTERSVVRGALAVLRGVDSNVVVPVGAISDLPSSLRDPYVEARASLAGPIGSAIAGLGWRLSGLAVEYDDVHPADIGALEAGIEWAGPITVDASIGHLSVGDHGYQRSLDLRLQIPLAQAGGWRVAIDGGATRIEALNMRAADLDGSQYGYGAVVDWGGGGFAAQLAYRHTLNDRLASALSPTQDRVVARLRYGSGRWVLRVWGRYVASDYPSSRDDDATDLGVEISLRFHPHWEGVIEATRFKNQSTESSFDYTSSRGSAGLRFRF